MRTKRSGIQTAVVGLVVAVVIVIAIAAFVVSSSGAKSTTSMSTSTSMPTTTSTPMSTTSSTSMASSSTSSSATTSTSSAKEGALVTYSADAYATEVTALLTNFSASSGVQVAPPTSGGSTADASAIEAGAPDDIFVSSSLAATSPADMGSASANWAIGFATDQMVVAYSNSTTQTAAATNVINLGKTAASSNATSDWNSFFTALVSGTVQIGISAPTQDPAGLRGWLVLEAAGSLYSGGNTSAYSSVLLADHDNMTAASAADLVSPLEAGNIQFLFIYKSAAVSDGLPYLALDPHVNLGDTSLAPIYAKFSYTDSAGTTKGAAIVIAVTVSANAANPSEAYQFVQYLVQNTKSLSKYGLVPLSPCVIYEGATPPAQIQQLVTQGLVVSGGALP